MKKFILVFFIRFIIIAVLYIIFYFLIKSILNIANVKHEIVLAAVAAIILAPRIKTIQTQSGEHIQITWFFFNKIITL